MVTTSLSEKYIQENNEIHQYYYVSVVYATNEIIYHSIF